MWRRVRWLPVVAVLLAVLGFLLGVLDAVDDMEGLTLAIGGLVIAVLTRDGGD
jgi:hypothetical protein